MNVFNPNIPRSLLSEAEPGRAPTAPALSHVLSPASRPWREGFSPGVSRQAPRGWGRRGRAQWRGETLSPATLRLWEQALGRARVALSKGPLRQRLPVHLRSSPGDGPRAGEAPTEGSAGTRWSELDPEPQRPGSDWATHRHEDTQQLLSQQLTHPRCWSRPGACPPLSSPFPWHYKSSPDSAWSSVYVSKPFAHICA